MSTADTVRDLVAALAELVAPSTTKEHADRTARNTLELVQARRQLDAVRAAIDREAVSDRRIVERPDDLLSDLKAALAPQPAPTEAGS